MKGQASFAVAIAVTAVSLPVNLPYVAGGIPGATGFIMSAAVAVSWFLVTVFCGFSLRRLAASAAVVMTTLAGVCALWVVPGLLSGSTAELAVMLAAAPLWGLGALAGSVGEALLLCISVCALLLVMLATSPWRLRKRLTDVSVFGPDPWKLANQPEYPDIDRLMIRRKLKGLADPRGD